MSKSSIATLLAAAACFAAACGAASAQMGPRDGSGPVGQLCQKEIASLCPDARHGGGAVRACLEGKRSSLSEACLTALDSTGRGRSAGMAR